MLPREILKWMQSLDLSYSVKNVRRDFANGFLIAEIFNRYFRHDVQMHSFDNGASMSKRQDNWGLLVKFFTKNDIPIQADEIESVINCKPNASVALVCKVYTILTGKAINVPAPLADEDDAPHYLNPTTSQLIYSRMNDSEMMGVQDTQKVHALSTKIMEEHMAKVRTTNRVASPQSTTTAPIHRGQTRQVSDNTSSLRPGQQIQFTKEVQVKQLDDNAAQVRKARGGDSRMDQHSTPGSRLGSQSPAAFASPARSPANNRNESRSQNNTTGTRIRTRGQGKGQPVTDIVGTIIKSNLVDQPFAELFSRGSERKEVSLTFVDELMQLPDEWVAQVLQEVTLKAATSLADSALSHPREFWNLVDLCGEAMTNAHEESFAFREAVSLFTNIGAKMVESDPSFSWDLLADFGLPKLMTLFHFAPHKRRTLIEAIYAFTMPTPDARLKALRKLKMFPVFEDVGTFVELLHVTIALEEAFSAEMLDLYYYYAVVGLKNSDAEARSQALYMLGRIASCRELGGHEMTLQAIDTIEAIAENADDATKVQIVDVMASILEGIDDEHPSTEPVYRVIAGILGATSPGRVLRGGLAHLSRCIGSHSTARQLWMSLLLKYRDVRADLLSLEPVVEDVPLARRMWDPLSVALAVSENVQITQPDNIGAGHLDLLCSAADDAKVGQEDVAEWEHIFMVLRDYILIELFDPELCVSSVHILRRFLHDPLLRPTAATIMERSATSKAPPMFGILKLVYGPEGQLESKKAVYKLLDDLISQDPNAFLSLVYNLIKNFAEFQAPKFQSSKLLQELLGKMERIVHNAE